MSEQPVSAYGGRGPMCLSVCWTLGAIATVLVILRIYSRLRLVTRGGGWALFWAVLAWALAVIDSAFMSLAISHGFGNHQEIVVQTGNVDFVRLWTWVTAGIFNTSVAVGKVAAVSFLLNMQGDTFVRKKWFLWFLAVTNILFGVANTFTNIIQCSPPAALWDSNVKGICKPEGNVNFTYFTGAWCAFSDLSLALYPIFLIWPLQTLEKRLKLTVCCLLGLSVFSAVCAALRTYEVREIQTEDPNYSLGILFAWGTAEMWVVLICSMVPPLYPLFKKITVTTKKRMSRSAGRSFRAPQSPGGLGVPGDEPGSPRSFREHKMSSMIGTRSFAEGQEKPERPNVNAEWVELK